MALSAFGRPRSALVCIQKNSGVFTKYFYLPNNKLLVMSVNARSSRWFYSQVDCKVCPVMTNLYFQTVIELFQSLGPWYLELSLHTQGFSLVPTRKSQRDSDLYFVFAYSGSKFSLDTRFGQKVHLKVLRLVHNMGTQEEPRVCREKSKDQIFQSKDLITCVTNIIPGMLARTQE